MAKKDVGGQPSIDKLSAEGVSARKCISYEGLGEYQGGGAKPSGNPAPKFQPSLASLGRKGGSGY